MSYRELTMTDVKEVLRRWSASQSVHQIARDAGVDRKTIRRYVQAAESCGFVRGCELTEAEIHEVAQRVQSRPVATATREWSEIAAHKERIVEWLGQRRPLRLRKVYVLLVREHGVQASYWTLRRYAMEELGWRKKPSTILLSDPPAGQEAQVDFGEMGLVFDTETERRRKLHALIITMSWSRYTFVWPTFLQTAEALCAGLDAAWRFFGAMPKTIVPDNPKAIVARPDALAPVISAPFLDYVQARGIFVDPARIRSPKDKPRVENQVPYVRENWFAGETFADMDEMRRSAEHWSREIAGARVHGTTRQVPREAFEATEKAVMLPPPQAPFDVPIWTDAKVHPDHHIQVARSLYSVPTMYLHKTVRVRADKTTVRIYLATDLIKMHPRVAPGRRSTDVADYPIGKAAYALRSVDALVSKAKEKGTHIGTYAERIVAGPLPWARMRQGYALLRLCDKFGDGRVEAVCQSALAFDVIDVGRITRMLKTAIKPQAPQTGSAKVTQLPSPRFARTPQHFETRPTAQSKEEV
jgi:transposase